MLMATRILEFAKLTMHCVPGNVVVGRHRLKRIENCRVASTNTIIMYFQNEVFHKYAHLIYSKLLCTVFSSDLLFVSLSLPFMWSPVATQQFISLFFFVVIVAFFLLLPYDHLTHNYLFLSPTRKGARARVHMYTISSFEFLFAQSSSPGGFY